MHSSSIHEFDWRKNASAAASNASSTPDDQVEQAFMNSAYTAVANKAGMLMEPQHALGFEIVSKNDTNTRLLGVFAFRVGQELLYAPVFFLNGDIKGTELLYRHSRKRFLPMDEKITRRLVAMQKNQLGSGVERSFARKQPQALQLDRVAFPPPTYKQATAETKTAVEDMLKKASFPSGILADFMRNQGGSDALTKLASLMERVPEFAVAFDERITRSALGLSDNGDPYPVDVAVETVLRGVSKKASAEEQAALRELAYQAAVAGDIGNTKLAAAFFGEETLTLRPAEAVLFSKSASDEERATASKRGYDLLDKRNDLKPAIVDDVESLMTLTRPGIHKVLDETGKQVEVRAFKRSPRYLSDVSINSYNGSGIPCCASSYGDYDRGFICLTTDDKSKVSQTLYGADTLVAESDSKKDIYDGLTELEKAKAGAIYFLVDKSTGEVINDAFKVESVGTDGQGLGTLTIRGRWDRDERELRLIRFNPDSAASKDRILGNTFLLAELSEGKAPEGRSKDSCPPIFEEPESFFVVGRRDLTEELRKSACREATLYHDNGFFSFAVEGQRQVPEARRMKAACDLACRLELPASSAEDLLDRAIKSGSVKFWFHTTGKQAGAVRVIDEPIFREDVDTNFGVDVLPTQEFALRTSQQRNYVPADRIGDHANIQPGRPQNQPEQLDSLPEEVLLNAPPEQLAQIGAQLKVPKLFEVGVVGSLASAYQSAAMIAQMLPKIEEALDALGRALFLFYWKPEDFKKAYGEDDLPGLEMELVSQFKGLGDIWLKLGQATPDKDPLAAPLPL